MNDAEGVYARKDERSHNDDNFREHTGTSFLFLSASVQQKLVAALHKERDRGHDNHDDHNNDNLSDHVYTSFLFLYGCVQQALVAALHKERDRGNDNHDDHNGDHLSDHVCTSFLFLYGCVQQALVAALHEERDRGNDNHDDYDDDHLSDHVSTSFFVCAFILHGVCFRSVRLSFLNCKLEFLFDSFITGRFARGQNTRKARKKRRE